MKKILIKSLTWVLLLIMLSAVLIGCNIKDEAKVEANPLIKDEKLSSGWLTFQDEKTGLYGFKDKSGEIVIAPTYKKAWDFYGGRAIVMVPAPENVYYGVLSDGIYGLIDPLGNYSIEPKGLLTRVDTWHYLVAEPTEFWAGYGPDTYSVIKKKLIDGLGEVHSDTGFYYVMPVSDHLLLANDGSKSYFIDDKGKVLDEYPSFYFPIVANQEGGKIFIKPLDDRSDRIKWVMSLDGQTLEDKMVVQDLNDHLSYTTQILSPYIGTSIFYPVFSMESLESQSIMNENIFSIVKEYQTNTTSMDTTELIDYNQVNHIDYTFSVDFSLTTIGDVINYEVNGYWYGFGGAHPNNLLETYYIDAHTGNRYNLADLFNSGSDWENAIAENVDEIFLNDDDMFLFIDHNTPKAQRLKEFHDAHYSATLTDKGLSIYYPQYEIAPYAAGFPTFEIPYEKLEKFYDKNGSFYKALFQ